MPDSWAGLAANPLALAVAIFVVILLLAAAALIARKYLVRGPAPDELERRRRLTIYREGKMGDGEIIDVETAVVSIVFSYSVAGVVYTASQDAAALRSMLPQDLMTMVGPVSIKFDPRNPANSIVLCEDWSGLRSRA
jgi:hypothetical protein